MNGNTIPSGCEVIAPGDVMRGVLQVTSEFALGVDTCEIPWGISPKWMREYRQMVWRRLPSLGGMGADETVLPDRSNTGAGP